MEPASEEKEKMVSDRWCMYVCNISSHFWLLFNLCVIPVVVDINRVSLLTDIYRDLRTRMRETSFSRRRNILKQLNRYQAARIPLCMTMSLRHEGTLLIVYVHTCESLLLIECTFYSLSITVHKGNRGRSRKASLLL